MKRAQNAVRFGIAIMGLSLTVLLTLLGTARPLGAATEEEQVSEYVKMLSAEDSREMNRGVDGILRDRKLLVEQLIPLVDPANAAKYKDKTRCAAAFLLGELRAVEAVPVLSKALAKEPGRKLIYRISRFDSPVWLALVKIGRPSVPAMIENIENSDHEILWKKSLDVLDRVLGGSRRVMELLAKLEGRAAKDDAKRSRIVRATKWAKQHWHYDAGTYKGPLY